MIARAEAKITDLLSDRTALLQEQECIQEQRKQQVRRDFENHVQIAAVANYLEEQGLLEQHGHKTAESYLASRWGGKPPCSLQLQHYLQVARHVPDPVVLSGQGGISVLKDVAKVAEEAEIQEIDPQQCKSFDLLCTLVLTGASHDVVRRGARAAEETLKEGKGDEAALLLARQAITTKRRRGSGNEDILQALEQLGGSLRGELRDLRAALQEGAVQSETPSFTCSAWTRCLLRAGSLAADSPVRR